MRILVTGGAGYIGSHTVLELLKENYEVVVIDNLSNSKETSLNRVKKLSNKDLFFKKVDLLDKNELDKVFNDSSIDAVIHFAGKKAVGESVRIPLDYYKNNITGTLNLLETMDKHNIKKLIFSSSATVYGVTEEMPLTEDFHISNTTSPYGRTKIFIEHILADLYNSDNSWHIIPLRYFNPVGADKSGEIGEDPNGIPNNLFPYITQVAVGKLEKLSVYGNDYPTPDGTCIRDYIHVSDLARGHVQAIDKLNQRPGLNIYNLGTGHGSSVLDVVQAFEKAIGKKIPYEFVDRRAGDTATTYADPSKAKKELNWEAKLNLDDMCRDAWNFQSKNPKGYEE
jgi:UDP-glucose 4-epimerase